MSDLHNDMREIKEMLTQLTHQVAELTHMQQESRSFQEQLYISLYTDGPAVAQERMQYIIDHLSTTVFDLVSILQHHSSLQYVEKAFIDLARIPLRNERAKTAGDLNDPVIQECIRKRLHKEGGYMKGRIEKILAPFIVAPEQWGGLGVKATARDDIPPPQLDDLYMVPVMLSSSTLGVSSIAKALGEFVRKQCAFNTPPPRIKTAYGETQLRKTPRALYWERKQSELYQDKAAWQKRLRDL